MKFNFRKIASVIASAVMIGSTMGTALAANYAEPFVVGGTASAAVVVGSGQGMADWDAAIALQGDLQGKVTTGTGTTPGTVTGEASALYTSSSKVWINSSLNSVKSSITKTELPTILADGSLSGNVDAGYTQTITLGSNPKLVFAKQPTSSDDPAYGFGLSTDTTGVNPIYNLTLTFNKAVNMTHADTKNQELTMFGKKFTIGSATTSTDLVLLKSATKLNFDSTGTTSQEVTIEGKKYTVEMVSASATTAIVKVTNEAGASDSKEVSEGFSKKINGLTIAVNTASTSNSKDTASIVAGAEKITLVDSSSITYGDTPTTIDGTRIDFDSANIASGITKISIAISAPNDDKDALMPGGKFVDPVFGTFKLDLSALNIPDTNSTAREDIKIKNSGDDKMTVEFTEYRGNSKSVQFAYNDTNNKRIELNLDSEGHQIHVKEMELINKSDYVVVGNEDEGYLLKVSEIINQTSGYSADSVLFTDVFSGDSYTTTITSDGTGTVTIGGKVYTVKYYGDSSLSGSGRQIRLDYPDSGAGEMIIYPTIQTSKGAKLMFYEPLNITMNTYHSNIDSSVGGETWTNLTGSNLTTIKFPSGADAYQSISVQGPILGNFSVNSVNVTTHAASTTVAITNTGFTLNFTFGGGAAAATNVTTVYLMAPDGGIISSPAIVLYEEKDNGNRYEGVVVTLENTGYLGVDEAKMTFGGDANLGRTESAWNGLSLYSNDKLLKDADKWGTIATENIGDSDRNTVTISYPDEQVYPQVYVAAQSASITGGTTSSGTGGVVAIFRDTETASFQDKNIVVVGGSCINAVARKILDANATSPICGADFTAKTNVDANKYLIKVVASPYNSAKRAVLVAGYEAAQTSAAVIKLKEGTLSTDVGTPDYIGPVVG